MTTFASWLPSRKPTPTALLGLGLDGSRLEVVSLRRTNGSVQIRKQLTLTLSLDPLADAPELVGREIRKQLNEAGIRDRHCTLCLPSRLALTASTSLPPDLAKDDQDSLLRLEAERAFPHAPESLIVACSRCQAPNGKTWVNLVAVPRERVTQVETALRHAQLRLVSISLDLPALHPPEPAPAGGALALVPGERSLGLMVCAGGGFAVLRALETDSDTTDGDASERINLLIREIRITLGLVPPDLSEHLRYLRVFGGDAKTDTVVEILRPRAESLGLRLEQVETYAAGQFGLQLAPDTAVSPALSLGVRHLAGKPAELEFLPARVRGWQQVLHRYASAKMAWAGAAAGLVALAIALAFLAQHWQYRHWRARWTRIQPQVSRLDSMQQELKSYRPWFDESVRSLTILRRLTEAFPEDGAVSAKTVEIREPNLPGEPPLITCTGTARNNAALLQLTDRLSAIPGVSNVHRDQTRGTTALQFSLNFRWTEGTRP